MIENKRFWSEYYSVGYYTEIVDNDKELTDVPNPKKNLTIGEVVDTLNNLYDENEELTYVNEHLKKSIKRQQSSNCECSKLIEEQQKENQRLIKMLDNVANYMQREHREIPINDFVEWWNKIATKGLDGDNSFNGSKIRKRKVKVDGRVDYVGISKEDLE